MLDAKKCRKARIGRKIFAWLIALLATLGILVILTYGMVTLTYRGVVNQLTKSIVTNHVMHIQNVMEELMKLQTSLVFMSDQTYQALLPGGAQGAKFKFPGQIREMRKAIERLSELLSNPEDKKLVQNIKRNFEAYSRKSKQILTLSNEGNMEAASKFLEESNFTTDLENINKYLPNIMKNNQVDERRLQRQINRAHVISLIIIVALFIISLIACSSIVTFLSLKISDALNSCMNFSQKLAKGDLTKTLILVPNRIVEAESEIGQLATYMNEMAKNLRYMLEEVSTSTNRVNSTSTEISSSSGYILDGANSQVKSIFEASNTVKDFTTAIDMIAANAVTMNESVQETAQSVSKIINGNATIDEAVNDLTNQVANTTAVIAEMSACTAQVHNSAKVMAEAVQSTSSTIEEMLASVEEVALNGKEVDKSVVAASSTVEEMLASIEEISKSIGAMNFSFKDAFKEIEILTSSVADVARDAKDAFEASEDTSKVAKSGGQSIQQSITGMKGIKTTVSETARRIRELGESSAQIGEIINVIRDIADQTNLLALNAAIEAARAGEEGRGFTVVADSIKKLAERSTEATKEIERLIRTIQKETEKAVTAMDDGVKEVEKGTQLADQAGMALSEIVASVNKTSTFMKQISDATHKQTISSDKVKQMMTSLANLSNNVMTLTQSQAEGTKRVKDSFESLREIAVQVKNSTTEQSKAGKQISHAIETLNGISIQLTTATAEQDKGSSQMELAMENINVKARDIQETTRKQKQSGENVLQQITKMRQMTQQVTDAASLQAKSSHKIVEKITSVGEIADNTAKKTDDVKSRAENLVGAVGTLEEVIAKFSLKEDEASEHNRTTKLSSKHHRFALVGEDEESRY